MLYISQVNFQVFFNVVVAAKTYHRVETADVARLNLFPSHSPQAVHLTLKQHKTKYAGSTASNNIVGTQKF